MRARIAEDEPAESALAKLGVVLDEIVTDPADRAFVEPRLQHLLGLTDRVAPDREDLFSGWRLFFERMAEQHPVVMVFEDLQWADAALIEFLEYLLDWSRAFPVFVLDAGPARTGRTPPDLGCGHRAASPRSSSSRYRARRWMRCCAASYPGCPTTPRADPRPRGRDPALRGRDRADAARPGLLEPGRDGYRVIGDLDALAVPETLHALIASRLDGLPEAERHCCRTRPCSARRSRPAGSRAISAARSVERPSPPWCARSCSSLDTDPRSPERGQYGFLQALVQRVAYDTLSRNERKTRHVAAARYLAEAAGIDPDEIAEVIAAHYLDAARADESADDALVIRAQARVWLERAGGRAASLAAADEAQRAFEGAASLAESPVEQAELLERAGTMARQGARLDESERLLARARELYVSAGDTHGAARAAAGLARALFARGRTDEAIAIGEEAYAVLAGDVPTPTPRCSPPSSPASSSSPATAILRASTSTRRST